MKDKQIKSIVRQNNNVGGDEKSCDLRSLSDADQFSLSDIQQSRDYSLNLREENHAGISIHIEDASQGVLAMNHILSIKKMKEKKGHDIDPLQSFGKKSSHPNMQISTTQIPGFVRLAAVNKHELNDTFESGVMKVSSVKEISHEGKTVKMLVPREMPTSNDNMTAINRYRQSFVPLMRNNNPTLDAAATKCQQLLSTLKLQKYRTGIPPIQRINILQYELDKIIDRKSDVSNLKKTEKCTFEASKAKVSHDNEENVSYNNDENKGKHPKDSVMISINTSIPQHFDIASPINKVRSRSNGNISLGSDPSQQVSSLIENTQSTPKKQNKAMKEQLQLQQVDKAAGDKISPEAGNFLDEEIRDLFESSLATMRSSCDDDDDDDDNNSRASAFAAAYHAKRNQISKNQLNSAVDRQPQVLVNTPSNSAHDIFTLTKQKIQVSSTSKIIKSDTNTIPLNRDILSCSSNIKNIAYTNDCAENAMESRYVDGNVLSVKSSLQLAIPASHISDETRPNTGFTPGYVMLTDTNKSREKVNCRECSNAASFFCTQCNFCFCLHCWNAIAHHQLIQPSDVWQNRRPASSIPYSPQISPHIVAHLDCHGDITPGNPSRRTSSHSKKQLSKPHRLHSPLGVSERAIAGEKDFDWSLLFHNCNSKDVNQRKLSFKSIMLQPRSLYGTGNHGIEKPGSLNDSLSKTAASLKKIRQKQLDFQMGNNCNHLQLAINVCDVQRPTSHSLKSYAGISKATMSTEVNKTNSHYTFNVIKGKLVATKDYD